MHGIKYYEAEPAHDPQSFRFLYLLDAQLFALSATKKGLYSVVRLYAVTDAGQRRLLEVYEDKATN